MGIVGAIFVLPLSALILLPPALTRGVRTDLVFEFPGPALPELMFLAIVGGLIVTVLSTSRKPVHAFVVVIALVVLLVAFTNIEVLPPADSHLSARAAARYSLQFVPSNARVEVYGLSWDWKYGLSYYFGRELPERMPGASLPDWLFTSERQALNLMGPGDYIYRLNNMAVPELVLLHSSSTSNTQR